MNTGTGMKRDIFFVILPFVMIVALCVPFFSCRKDLPEQLFLNQLFSISLGKLEDQIDLFRVRGGSGNMKNDFFMKDGSFYIENSNS